MKGASGGDFYLHQMSDAIFRLLTQKWDNKECEKCSSNEATMSMEKSAPNVVYWCVHVCNEREGEKVV